MGVATESNYSILKMKTAKDTQIKSKISTRPSKETYKDPSAKTPFEKHLNNFFDSSETKAKLFKERNYLESHNNTQKNRRVASAVPASHLQRSR